MFLLNGNAFSHLNLELVVVDDLAGQLNGELILSRCLKESWNIVGNTHQINWRGTLVFEFHGCRQLLSAVRAKTTS